MIVKVQHPLCRRVDNQTVRLTDPPLKGPLVKGARSGGGSVENIIHYCEAWHILPPQSGTPSVSAPGVSQKYTARRHASSSLQCPIDSRSPLRAKSENLRWSPRRMVFLALSLGLVSGLRLGGLIRIVPLKKGNGSRHRCIVSAGLTAPSDG
jgi:hypothetical protein